MSKLIKKFIENHGQEVFNEIKKTFTTLSREESKEFDRLVMTAETFRKLVSEIDSNNVPSKRVKDFFLDEHTKQYMIKYPGDEALIREQFGLHFPNEYISKWTKDSSEFFSDTVELLLSESGVSINN